MYERLKKLLFFNNQALNLKIIELKTIDNICLGFMNICSKLTKLNQFVLY